MSNIFKGPAHLVYYIILNLNISASRQNIKNLINNFGAIHVGIMHAKFQAFKLSPICFASGKITLKKPSLRVYYNLTLFTSDGRFKNPIAIKDSGNINAWLTAS